MSYEWMDRSQCVPLGVSWDRLDAHNRRALCRQCPVVRECAAHMGVPVPATIIAKHLTVGDTCRNGHLIGSSADLAFTRGRPPQCRECGREATRLHRARQKGAAPARQLLAVGGACKNGHLIRSDSDLVHVTNRGRLQARCRECRREADRRRKRRVQQAREGVAA